MTAATSRRRRAWIQVLTLSLVAGCGGSVGSSPTSPPVAVTSAPASPAALATEPAATGSSVPTDGVFASPTSPPRSCAAIPDGIVAWWRAEDDASDSVGDAAGVLKGGAGFGPGNVGRAFSFDGQAQEVEVGDTVALQLKRALTIEGWVLAPKAPVGYAGIAGTWDDATGANRTYLFWVLNGALDFAVSTDGNAFGRVTDTAPLPIGRWVHLAGTYDGAAIRIYVDGKPVGESAMSGDLATNSRPFAIGRTNGGAVGANYWSGSIDELSVYDRALSSAEVAAIHAAGDSGKCAT